MNLPDHFPVGIAMAVVHLNLAALGVREQTCITRPLWGENPSQIAPIALLYGARNRKLMLVEIGQYVQFRVDLRFCAPPVSVHKISNPRGLGHAVATG